jgi:hypothetical protein
MSSPANELWGGNIAVTEEGVIVHPWYRGYHQWKVDVIAEMPQLIHYDDFYQGEVTYAPKVLLLDSEWESKVLWFT